MWDVEDDESLVLLATLNRLRGRDDPRKRAALLATLANQIDAKALSARLPETPEKLRAMLAMSRDVPTPRPPQRLEDMPVAVHFFLRPKEKRLLDRLLKRIGGTREAALLQLVMSRDEQVGASSTHE